MMRNIHPADELAQIRADIKRLKTREDVLRRGFLAGVLPPNGDMARVDVRVTKRLAFTRERLPDEVLADKTYWIEKVTKLVRVLTVPEPPRAVVRDSDLAVFESY